MYRAKYEVLRIAIPFPFVAFHRVPR